MKKIYKAIIILLNVCLLGLFATTIVIKVFGDQKNPLNLKINSYKINGKMKIDNLDLFYNHIKNNELSYSDIYCGYGDVKLFNDEIYTLDLDYIYEANVGLMYGVLGIGEVDTLYVEEDLATRSVGYYLSLEKAFNLLKDTKDTYLKEVNCVSFTNGYTFEINKGDLVYDNGKIFNASENLNGRFYNVIFYNDINNVYATVHVVC